MQFMCEVLIHNKFIMRDLGFILLYENVHLYICEWGFVQVGFAQGVVWVMFYTVGLLHLQV